MSKYHVLFEVEAKSIGVAERFVLDGCPSTKNIAVWPARDPMPISEVASYIKAARNDKELVRRILKVARRGVYYLGGKAV